MMHHTFLVAEIDQAPILLGTDFLKAHHLSINFGNNRISRGSKFVPLVPSRGKFITKGTERFYVQDKVSNIRYLLDSGSSNSLINPKLIKEFHPDRQSLRSASGKEIQVIGTKKLELNFGLAETITQKFLVTNDSIIEAVLGVDFLKQNKITIHGRKQEAEHKGKIIKLLGEGDEAEIGNLFKDILAMKTHDKQEDGEYAIIDKCNTLVNEFPDVFAPPDYHAPPKHKLSLDIELTDYTPLRQKARPCTPQQLTILRDNFKDLVERNIVVRGSPSHVCPTTIVRKSSGEPRVCVDFTRLNRVTKWITYPLPKLQNLASVITPDHKIFSTLDIKEAYYNIPLTPRASKLAGIISPEGAFFPKRCPFGLKNAPFKFVELIDEVIDGLRHFVWAYIDDFIIFSKTKDDHLVHLRALLERFQRFGLHVNKEKCLFVRKSVPFLGRIISTEGVHLSETKVSHILSQKPPTNLKELRGFLGLVNHYRPHLPRLSKIAEPLTNLLQGPKKIKRAPIPWNDSCARSFNEVLETVERAATLGFDDPKLPLYLTTDASGWHVGATLEQRDPVRKEIFRPLAFFSKALPKGKTSRSAFYRELCGLRLAVQHFRHRIRGRRLVVLTDHKALLHALNNGVGQHSPTEVSWLDEIREYCPEVRHISGESNVTADFLSRPPQVLALTREGPNLSLSLLHRHQTLDQCEDLEGQVTETRAFQGENDQIFPLVGVMCCESNSFLPYIPTSLRPVVFHLFHARAHLGAKKTQELLSAVYFWPTLEDDVRHWCSHCPQCQRNKTVRHNRQNLMNFPLEPGRMNVIHIDLVGPLPSVDGYPYIMTCKDRNSGFLVTAALPSKTSSCVIEAFEQNFIGKFGIPDTLISDQGREFVSQKFRAFCDGHGINHRVINAYHPQANGLGERTHRILKTSIRSLRDPHGWHRALPYITLQLNNQTSDKNKFTPAQMIFGKASRLPGVLIPTNTSHTTSETNLKIFMDLMSFHLTERRPLRDNRAFLEPDLFEVPTCWVRDDTIKSPISPVYRGPYDVLDRGPKTFRLWMDGEVRSVSIDRVKAHHRCDEPSCVEANGLSLRSQQ